MSVSARKETQKTPEANGKRAQRNNYQVLYDEDLKQTWGAEDKIETSHYTEEERERDRSVGERERERERGREEVRGQTKKILVNYIYSLRFPSTRVKKTF